METSEGSVDSSDINLEWKFLIRVVLYLIDSKYQNSREFSVGIRFVFILFIFSYIKEVRNFPRFIFSYIKELPEVYLRTRILNLDFEETSEGLVDSWDINLKWKFLILGYYCKQISNTKISEKC